MKKTVCLILTFFIFLTFFGCGENTASQVSSVPVSSQDTPPLSVGSQSGVENKVTLVSRTTVEKQGIWLSWSGSGVEFTFEGESVTATLCASLVFGSDYPMLVGVFVDNSETAKKTFTVTSETKEYTLCEKLSKGSHTVKLLKLSEAQYGSVCIEDIKAQNIKPAEKPELTFEFIGDSIVCGNGTGAKSSRGEFKTSEQNVSLTAGFKLAQKYGATARFFCATGYNADSVSSNNKKILNVYKRKAPFLVDQMGIGDGEYEFGDAADMVFINIGSDCASKIMNNEQEANFVSGYVELINFVREKNPDADIFILNGTATNTLDRELNDVYELVKTDEKIHYFKFSFESKLVYNGLGAGYPSAHSNERMYKELLKELKRLGIKPQ